jgi:HlyD family secretion protein
VIAGIALVSAFVYFAIRRNAPPEVPFTRVARETIVSSLTTNGRVEPIAWASARAETAGVVRRVMTERGRTTAAGAPLVELNAVALTSEAAAARARVSQAEAELQNLKQGGRSADLAALDANLQTARQELAQAQREYEANRRLQEKNAITGQEVTAARERVDRAQLQIKTLEQRRQALVGTADRSAAEARLREAQASAAGVQQRIATNLVRASIGGVVYEFDLRPGAYVNPGDLIANIGRLDTMRVIVYVDEPDLGRVEVGMPVTITWDAVAGRQWTGTVERKPTQVVPLGTRQVGEVTCVIENPGQELLPGTNVNAEIRSRVVENAVAIPNAAIRREGGRTGVYLLTGGKIEWRDVELGATSVVRAQVVRGLNEGDSIALPTDRILRDGMPVTPVYP